MLKHNNLWCPGDDDQNKEQYAGVPSCLYTSDIFIDRSFKITTANQWNEIRLSETQESSSTWSHFVVKLRSRVRKTDVAPDNCYSKCRAEHPTLVQAVTKGHLGQFHLRPRVVQDLPAPLERTQDALLLQPGFGTHIEPRPQNTSQNLDLAHLKLGRIVLLSRETVSFYQTHPDFEYQIFFTVAIFKYRKIAQLWLWKVNLCYISLQSLNITNIKTNASVDVPL